MDGDWCSLEELGPLGKLNELDIDDLENISSTLFVRKARLDEKARLRVLSLNCTTRHGDDGSLLKGDEKVSNKGQQQIEEVFDELCPPPCLEVLVINGYFGRRLPGWLMSAADMSIGSLRILMMEGLPCCTELPDVLCQLPTLELLQIEHAPSIKRVGPEFLHQPHQHEHSSALENLGSAAELVVYLCSGLERINNLPKTRKLKIIRCPKLKILEGLPALQSLLLQDYEMETLPRYLQHVNPRHLEVQCNESLLTSMAAGESSPEWVKFSHIQQVKAYADDDENNIDRKWYVLYTRDPFSFKTNISRSAIVQAHRKRVRLAYSKTCPIEEEWMVGRADADKRQPLCQRFRCNAYFRLGQWLCPVCLHCCEAVGIATSSYQWTEAAEYHACRGITVTAQQFARPQRA
ncbi:hypothetical protein QOZ80_9BG0694960 [Eleusine coracana subsp. coracana]|nr:hypothetical protein QOZ80_9BG0694960 [Eleusine coracana subsp. coracana]